MRNRTDDGAADREALGEPPGATTTEPEPDFAAEHEATAVSDDVITGADEDRREPESPRGWSGQEEGSGGQED